MLVFSLYFCLGYLKFCDGVNNRERSLKIGRLDFFKVLYKMVEGDFFVFKFLIFGIYFLVVSFSLSLG